MKSKCQKRAVKDVAKEPYKSVIPALIDSVYGFFRLFGIYSLIALLRLRHRVRNISMIYLAPCFNPFGLLIMLFVAAFPGILE